MDCCFSASFAARSVRPRKRLGAAVTPFEFERELRDRVGGSRGYTRLLLTDDIYHVIDIAVELFREETHCYKCGGDGTLMMLDGNGEHRSEYPCETCGGTGSRL